MFVQLSTQPEAVGWFVVRATGRAGQKALELKHLSNVAKHNGASKVPRLASIQDGMGGRYGKYARKKWKEKWTVRTA